MRQMETDSYSMIQVEPAEDILPNQIGIPSLSASTLFIEERQLQSRQLPQAFITPDYIVADTSEPIILQARPDRAQHVPTQWSVSSPTRAVAVQKEDLSIFILLLTLLVLGVLGGIGFGYLISISHDASVLSFSHTFGTLIASHVSFLSGGH